MADKRKRMNRVWVMYVYIALFVIATLYVGAQFYNSYTYEDRIYPGITVAGAEVGGKTKSEANEMISKKIQQSKKNMLIVGEEKYTLTDSQLGLSYDVQKTVDNAYEIGRKDLNFIKSYKENIPIVVTADEVKAESEMFGIIDQENSKVEDAVLKMQNGKLSTSGESIGKRVLLLQNIEMIKSEAGNLNYQFSLQAKAMDPSIKEEDIKRASEEIEKVLSEKIILSNNGKKYQIKEGDLAGFIYFQKSDQQNADAFLPSLETVFPLPGGENGVRLAYDHDSIRSWAVSFSKKVDQTPMNAKLSGSGGGVVVEAAEREGRKVMVDDLASKIQESLDKPSENEIAVPVQVTKPEVRSDNLAELGLKELISTGWTDFSGSPSNRKVNISVGASKFNGALIKPGENFSFNTTLGAVDASTGYLPELVILKDKTVPEYGGGLCQVSSTAFRAALNAGLPITSRSAHAYPVGYYKPYGVDATIYLPSPDLMFKNDTPGYILVQTHINGNKLYFHFYGTKKDISIKFAGDVAGTQGVSAVAEGLTPTITEQEARGEGSFTATFYRLLYDNAGKLIKTNYWISKYDSPKKYPH